VVPSRRQRARRRRLGRVSYYRRRGGWCISYRDAGRQVRRRVADGEAEAATIAAQVNAQLASVVPTPFSFTPVTINQLRGSFLDHHEYVLRSSLSTISRYRSALRHLEGFAAASGSSQHAHLISVEQFAAYLRRVLVAPNGHPHTSRRRLRDKGVRFILEVCRSLYAFAGRRRHLPPYAENPFGGLSTKRIRIEDAKPLFVFDAATEAAFLAAADGWSFPIQFTLAKTGMRPGELIHLLVEDLDL
jgi:integrase